MLIAARESDAVVKFEELSSEVNLTILQGDQDGVPIADNRLGMRHRLASKTPQQRKARAIAQKMENLRTALCEFYLNLILVQNFQVLAEHEQTAAAGICDGFVSTVGWNHRQTTFIVKLADVWRDTCQPTSTKWQPLSMQACFHCCCCGCW